MSNSICIQYNYMKTKLGDIFKKVEVLEGGHTPTNSSHFSHIFLKQFDRCFYVVNRSHLLSQ